VCSHPLTRPNYFFKNTCYDERVPTNSTHLGYGISLPDGYILGMTTRTRNKMPADKQLRNIQLVDVLEKRRLDQALNAKEFAVCAGVSYSTSRSWFRLPGFPAFRRVVFWQDFVHWRTNQNGLASQPESLRNVTVLNPLFPKASHRALREFFKNPAISPTVSIEIPVG
jgi:hypothetical protein